MTRKKEDHRLPLRCCRLPRQRRNDRRIPRRRIGRQQPGRLLSALGDDAKARGMAKIAKDAGLSRESLYKALAPDAKPRYETVRKLMDDTGVKMTAQSAAHT